MSAETLRHVHVDHVGSLLRPKELRDARDRLLGVQDATHNLGAHSNAELAKIEDKHVRDVVALQESVGLKIVTDGEFRRRSWWTDFYLSLTGTRITYDGKSPIKFVNAAGDTRPTPEIMLEGKIKWQKSVNTEPFRFLKSVTKVTPKVSLPAPPMLHFMRANDDYKKTYRDNDALWADLVAAYRAEIKALYDAGCRHIQLDECMLAFLCDPRHREVSRRRGDDPDDLIRQYAKVINDSISQRPKDMTATMHVCRGNLNAYWGAAGGYEPVAEAAFKHIEVDGYLLEYDTPRAGDFTPLGLVPKNKVVYLGLMSTKETRLETADELRKRIDEASKFVAHDRLGVCPQCGFSTNVFGTHFTVDDERRKLGRLVEVADKVWGHA
jgi:5-methyltetrahydropteroyltriglutamate--homocysteine methyltransferase